MNDTQSPGGGTLGDSWRIIPQPQRIKIVVRFEDRKEREFPLQKPVVKLGRVPDNDIILPFEYISSYHAQFHRLFDGQWEVVDLGSFNSTSKNGKKIERARIKAGDLLVFGILGARVELIEEKPPEPPMPPTG